MAVSKRLRFEVLRRDDHACRYCGARAPGVALTIDHVVPVALGGQDVPENLVTACEPCNAGKSSITPEAPLVADVADDALRWGRAMAAATAAAEVDRHARWKVLSGFEVIWNSWFKETDAQFDYHRPSDWESSIAQFLDAGLTAEDVGELAADCLSRPKIKSSYVWLYFCGAAWNEVTRRQERARELIATGAIE